MNRCEQQEVRFLLYLDHDLKGRELEEFRAHLAECADCARKLKEEEQLSDVLRRTRPLYTAPETLRASVEQLSSPKASLPERVPSPILWWRRVVKQWRLPTAHFSWKTAAALIVFVTWLTLIPAFERQAQARAYVHAAASIHRGHLRGEVPLGLRSSSPEVVTAWLAGKVPFEFRLPASQSVPSDNRSYHIAGVSQVSYQGRGAALVIYERRNETISLLVASSKSAVVAGGEQVQSGNLVFHYRSEDGLRVITWTAHGLSYALVSALSGSARESCVVCHEGGAGVNQFRVAR